MNPNPAFFTLALFLATSFVSWQAFTSPGLRQKLIFDPQRILADKEYHRLITHAFLHGSWAHLIFNMICLYMFAEILEAGIGPAQLAVIYFSSIIGGGLLSLFVHRHHAYQGLGASGGVAGVLFATLFLAPGTRIGILFIPFIQIPGWAFAILYLAYSFHALREGSDNLAHDAHIGGAIIGLLAATTLHPEIIRASPILYPVVLILSTAILYCLIAHPFGLPPARFRPPRLPRLPRRQPPGQPARDDDRTDALLERISKNGIQSLTPEERAYLRRRSK